MTKKGQRRWWRYPVALVGMLVGLVTVWLVAAGAVYSPEYVRRVLAWQESDQEDYLHRFPLRPLRPSPSPQSVRC